MGEPRRRQGEEHDIDGTGEDKEALRSLLTEAEVEQYYSRMVRHGIRDVRTLAQQGHHVLKLLAAEGLDLKRLRHAIQCGKEMIAEQERTRTKRAT